jgi:hypothetical protein
VGLDYEVLSQRFVLLFWLSITIQLLRFKALILRAGSILPPPLLSVKGSTPREQKTPPIITACEVGIAFAHVLRFRTGSAFFQLYGFAVYPAKSLGLNLRNYSGFLLYVKVNQRLFFRIIFTLS